MTWSSWLIVFLLLAVPAAAHLDAGEDRMVNGYLIDFGFAPELPKAGQAVSFALNLINESTGETLRPEAVWVRIASEEVLFAGTFAPQSGSTAFSYTFPDAGTYDITARFLDSSTTLAGTTFTLGIEGKKNPAHFLAAGVLVVVIAGAAALRKIMR